MGDVWFGFFGWPKGKMVMFGWAFSFSTAQVNKQFISESRESKTAGRILGGQQGNKG